MCFWIDFDSFRIRIRFVMMMCLFSGPIPPISCTRYPRERTEKNILATVQQNHDRTYYFMGLYGIIIICHVIIMYSNNYTSTYANTYTINEGRQIMTTCEHVRCNPVDMSVMGSLYLSNDLLHVCCRSKELGSIQRPTGPC